MTFELDPCRVHGQGGELVAAGHVRSADATTLAIVAPRYSGYSLEPGDRVVVEVASAVRGECTFDATVLMSNKGYIELTDLSLRSVVQKRLAVRVRVSVPLQFLAQVEAEDEPADESVAEPAEAPEPVEPPEPVEAVVIDVSAEGLRFRTEEAVPVGTRLEATFPADRPVRLVVEVLRHEELRGAVLHGCRFVEIAERDQDTMYGFVLVQERRQIAERRDTLSQ